MCADILNPNYSYFSMSPANKQSGRKPQHMILTENYGL